MKEFSILVRNVLTIQSVAEIINEDVNDYGDKDEIAATYAYDACDTDGKYVDDEIEAHLDMLVESGAVFDYQKAKKIAISYVGGERWKK
jgi:hypothetical protein